MRINKKSYPILDTLNNKSLGKIPFHENDVLFLSNQEYFDDFVNTWKKNVSGFLKEINVVTNPFRESVIKVLPKLNKLAQDVTKSGFKYSGTYVTEDIVLMINVDVNMNEDLRTIPSAFYVFHKSGIPLVYMKAGLTDDPSENTVWISKLAKDKGIGMTVKDISIKYLSIPMLYETFKKYASVDIKIMPPNTKIKSVKYRYKNETNLKLTLLDSKWFTTIIKSDAFKVSGHFRLQPKKVDGVWTKEIIWINDFEKTGYTSKAKVLSHKETVTATLDEGVIKE